MDKTSKLLKNSIKATTDLTLESLSLVMKLFWPKNVMDEQDGTTGKNKKNQHVTKLSIITVVFRYTL